MWLNELCRRWTGTSAPARRFQETTARRRGLRLLLEQLEDRMVPSSNTLLISGLEGSQGSTVGPGHDLYVTESVTGQITRIDTRTGEATTFASGLPISPFAGFGGGAIDVAFLDDTAYVLVT